MLATPLIFLNGKFNIKLVNIYNCIDLCVKTNLSHLNINSVEVGENYLYLLNLRPKTHFIPDNSDLMG